jgi:hypothetical protein
MPLNLQAFTGTKAVDISKWAYIITYSTDSGRIVNATLLLENGRNYSFWKLKR